MYKKKTNVPVTAQRSLGRKGLFGIWAKLVYGWTQEVIVNVINSIIEHLSSAWFLCEVLFTVLTLSRYVHQISRTKRRRPSPAWLLFRAFFSISGYI